METKNATDFNPDQEYEYLGRYVFQGSGKACDPLGVAGATVAPDYYRGSLTGKKNISVILLRLLFEAQLRRQTHQVAALTDLYDQVWNLPEGETDGTGQASIIMASLIEIAESVMELGSIRNAYY